MKTRTSVTIAAAALTALGSLAAHNPPPEGFEYVPKSEFINFNIGCDQTDTGTCETTEYWLGLDTGDSNVAQLGWLSPLDWATTTVNGSYRYTAFAGNTTLDPQYILNAHEDIEGVVVVGGYVTGAEFSADSGVSLVFSARYAETNSFLPLGSAEVTKVVAVAGAADPTMREYEFTLDLDDELEGVAITALNVDVGMKHLTVLGNGFMNGQGGSYFELPYYELRALPEEPTPEG